MSNADAFITGLYISFLLTSFFVLWKTTEKDEEDE